MKKNHLSVGLLSDFSLQNLFLFFFFMFQQVIEFQDHPFYVGVQFHPEFKSRPTRPSPLFLGKS